MVNSQDALVLMRSYLFGFSVVWAEKQSPGGDKGLVPRNDVLTSGFILYDVPLHRPLHEYFLYLASAPPPLRNPEVLRIDKAFCVVQSDLIIGVTL